MKGYNRSHVSHFILCMALSAAGFDVLLCLKSLIVEVLDNILPRDDADKAFLIVQYRYKILVQRLPDQILHICPCLYRAVIQPTVNGSDGYLLRTL